MGVARFKDTVKVIEDFCAALVNFDTSLKTIDEWKEAATAELKDIKEASGAMLPEDRVARTMDLKEWTLLDNTVTELNSWVAKDKSSEGENQFSLEKMETTLGELKDIFKEKEKLVEGL